jgi:hypothetical protein
VNEPEDELFIKGAAKRQPGRSGSRARASDAAPPPAGDGPSDIRSRLRSHQAPPQESSSLPSPSPLAAPKKRGRGGKGKGRPHTETYYWSCPVCERIHSSVKVGEAPWTHDKSNGGIALYV